MRVQSMSAMECGSVVDKHRLGHLACSQNDRPYVVPIYYAHRDKFLYSFSMPGKKIDIMRSNPHVSVLVEEFTQDRAWKSVIMEGMFEELPDRVGSKIKREQAWLLLSRYAGWWEPGSLKPAPLPTSDHSDHLFYRISIDAISGRETIE